MQIASKRCSCDVFCDLCFFQEHRNGFLTTHLQHHVQLVPHCDICRKYAQSCAAVGTDGYRYKICKSCLEGNASLFNWSETEDIVVIPIDVQKKIHEARSVHESKERVAFVENIKEMKKMRQSATLKIQKAFRSYKNLLRINKLSLQKEAESIAKPKCIQSFLKRLILESNKNGKKFMMKTNKKFKKSKSRMKFNLERKHMCGSGKIKVDSLKKTMIQSGKGLKLRFGSFSRSAKLLFLKDKLFRGND